MQAGSRKYTFTFPCDIRDCFLIYPLASEMGGMGTGRMREKEGTRDVEGERERERWHDGSSQGLFNWTQGASEVLTQNTQTSRISVKKIKHIPIYTHSLHTGAYASQASLSSWTNDEARWTCACVFTCWHTCIRARVLCVPCVYVSVCVCVSVFVRVYARML